MEIEQISNFVEVREVLTSQLQNDLQLQTQITMLDQRLENMELLLEKVLSDPNVHVVTT